MLGCDKIKQEVEEGSVFVKDEPISEDSEGEEDKIDWENSGSLPDGQVKREDHERDTSTSPVGGKILYRYCAYCYERTARNDMVAFPKLAEQRKQWIDVLGKQFESFIEDKKLPFLCKKHFDDETGLPKAEAIYEGRKFKKERKKTVKTKTCCYCGIRKARRDMRSVPTNPGKRELWIHILGEKFREDIKFLYYAFICNSHFPKSLMSSDGKISNLTLPIPLGETPSHENHFFPITTKMGCECAFCGKHDFIVKMVPVPEGPTRDSWCFILGERFAMNLTKLEHLYICSSHFHDKKPTKDSIPFSGESSKSKETDNIPKKKKTLRRYNCTYCSEWLENEHMVTVQMTPFRLETWCDVLGEEFEFRVFETELIRMCRIHFRREDFVDQKYRILMDEAVPIPIAVSQRGGSSDFTNLKQCFYCKKFGKYRNMRRIVYDECRWPIYIEVFGPDFVKHFWEEQHNLPAVCRIHLNENGLRLRFVNFQDLQRIALEAQVDF